MGIAGEDYEIWLEGLDRPKYSNPTLPQEVNYSIIGGGITGITFAYLLSKENKKTVLLEKRILGEWVTDCTTGFLTQVIDTDPIKLIKLFGLESAKLVLASHGDAINGIEKIIADEKIECDFKRCSNFIYANNNKEEKKLLKIAEAFNKLGVKVEYKKDELLKFSKFGYIEMPNQAKFHIMKYITALAKIAVSRGVVISENTEVLSVNNSGDHVIINLKGGGIMKAKKVISATYTPFAEPKNLSEKTSLYRSYVLEYDLPIDSFLEGTYEDELDPYHYFRIDKENNHTRMVIGGEDNIDIAKSNRQISYDVLRKYTEKILTGYEHTEKRHWSGRILNSIDGLAFIGESKGENIFYTFAFGGNGITYSYIAANIFVDTLNKRENIYQKIYSTDRKISFWTSFFK